MQWLRRLALVLAVAVLVPPVADALDLKIAPVTAVADAGWQSLPV